MSPENSVRLAARIRERSGCARLLVYSDLDHFGIIAALAVPRLMSARVLDDVSDFPGAPAMS